MAVQPLLFTPLEIAGVTLPGVPSVVAGSNGSVAWGFTNSYGDWVDLVELERRAHRARDLLNRAELLPLALQRLLGVHRL